VKIGKHRNSRYLYCPRSCRQIRTASALPTPLQLAVQVVQGVVPAVQVQVPAVQGVVPTVLLPVGCVPVATHQSPGVVDF
jgi:hypothetical protein